MTDTLARKYGTISPVFEIPSVSLTLNYVNNPKQNEITRHNYMMKIKYL